jgi:drug/metabolite transporter (DMT)-like permease
MFIGEFCCLFVYFGKMWINQRKVTKGEIDEMPLSPGGQMATKTNLRTTINPLYLLIPASCDICGSTLMFVALTMCAASIYQMMRGIIVLITSLLSVWFLGKKQYCHHWSSLFVIVGGVAIVGLVGILESEPDPSGDTTPTSALGVGLLLIAQIFTGLQFISEEKILSGYYLDPLLVVGLEGFWGCCYYAILLPIF